MNQLFELLGFLIVLIQLYRWLYRMWLQRWMNRKKSVKLPRKPRVLKPKTEHDCPVCQQHKSKATPPAQLLPIAWSTRKGRGGPRKKISTQGFACPNPLCEDHGIRDEAIHALVGDGTHGKHAAIQDLKCQACGKKFTVRRNTLMYRLKHSPDTVARDLWLLALGVDISALEEVFKVCELTIRTWLARSGVQSMKIHERFMVQLDLLHLQLDELWASVKFGGHDLWVWVVSDATTKLVPVLQVGSRSQEMAYRVVHELKRRLRSDSTPVFASDGLKHYFYALTAHFGQWEPGQGKKPVWVLLSQFAYAQVIKHQRRRRTVKVERRLLWGDEQSYRSRLKQAGLSGRINTSFVERINLTIRQSVSKLTRRTWGPAHYSPELLEHLEWWRCYYHFARYHDSLAVELSHPIQRKGRQQPLRYRRRTPAMAAGLTTRRWSVSELISYPV